jgi:hypothetical protein
MIRAIRIGSGRARALGAAATLLLGLLLAGPARADEDYDKATWPLRLTQRPLVLAPGMLEVSADLHINVSEGGDDFDRVYLPLGVFYGVNRQLTVGIDHEIGICFSGCDKTYNDIGVTGLYSLMGKGSFQAALQAGLRFPELDPDVGAGIEAGMDVKLIAGSLALVAEPLFYFGLASRDEVRKDTLAIPLRLEIQVNEQTALYVFSGFFGPLDGFGDNLAIPVGLGALFAVSNRIDVGAEFRFTNLIGNNGGAEGREILLRAALRL